MTLLVLTTPDKIHEALWTAYSFLFWQGADFALEIVVDGPVSAEMAKTAQHVFPGCTTEDGRKYRETDFGYKSINTFVRDFKYGAKLGLILSKTANRNVIYCDSDILFFSRSADITSWVSCEQPRPPRFVVDRSSDYLAAPMRKKYRAEGADIPTGFNSGFFLTEKGSFSLPFIDNLLEKSRLLNDGKPVTGHWDGAAYHIGWEYFTEQWIMGASFARARGQPLPEEAFFHSNAGMNPFQKDPTDYSKICMRHFFGNVRHRLYTNGMPSAKKRMRLP
ncbi:hypothetical protein [uncultured Pelagimonas sp.]|uniref:hypothetical protein n=1 Tax=uncultured Pelagimonas sp. TaxID=1618102 RepID=UPI0026274A7A|nr:hypothetical protein [uncultured Pelagimonas sp.]